MWCLGILLVLLDDRHSLWTTCGVSAIFWIFRDDRYMSLCTRTCVVSTVLWIFWLDGTCLCLSSGTSIPIKMLALRYLSRLLYRLDGWCLVLYHNWENRRIMSMYRNWENSLPSGSLNHKQLSCNTATASTTSSKNCTWRKSTVFWIFWMICIFWMIDVLSLCEH